ncbi:MAG: hypothetical protein WCO83_07915 [Alphaproteobacteria bacterium]
MILKRAILIACAVSALASASGVFIFALAFALFAALAPGVGPALAAAGVAGATLIVFLIVALVAVLTAKPGARRKTFAEPDMTTKLLALARDKPIIAAAALVAAGVIAVRNPKIMAGLVATFMAAKPPGSGKA